MVVVGAGAPLGGGREPVPGAEHGAQQHRAGGVQSAGAPARHSLPRYSALLQQVGLGPHLARLQLHYGAASAGWERMWMRVCHGTIAVRAYQVHPPL